MASERDSRLPAWLTAALDRLGGPWQRPPPAYRDLRTARRDRTAWEVPEPTHLVAVGDVHGDLWALASILLDRGLVDKKGRWSGGASHLVLNGDIVGGRGSRALAQLLIRLEREASEQGGGVHALLGNQDLKALRRKRRRRDGRGPAAGTKRAAFWGDTPWARWLRRRNAVLKTGATLFAHAGINEWAWHHHPARVNASIRAWIRFWQGVGPEPDERTRWTVEKPDDDWSPPSSGPLWTRSFKAARRLDAGDPRTWPSRAPSPERLAAILARYHADRIVVGHAPVRANEILLSHPVYGARVVMIDTRISQRKKGRLSCLEIRGGRLRAVDPLRSKGGKRVAERERRGL